MKIVIELSDEEANRQVEDEEENIRPAYQQVIREVENALTYHQIRYENIRTEDD